MPGVQGLRMVMVAVAVAHNGSSLQEGLCTFAAHAFCVRDVAPRDSGEALRGSLNGVTPDVTPPWRGTT